MVRICFVIIFVILLTGCNFFHGEKDNGITIEKPLVANTNMITKEMLAVSKVGVFVSSNGDIIPVNNIEPMQDTVMIDGNEIIRTLFDLDYAVEIPYAGNNDTSFFIFGDNISKIGFTRLAAVENNYVVFLEKMTVDGDEKIQRRGRSFAYDQFVSKPVEGGVMVKFAYPLTKGNLLITYKDRQEKTILVKVE